MSKPLTGPVYLRGTSDSSQVLPDLVGALSGDGIEVDVVGKIDSRLGGLRARFEVLPDAPVTKFTMTLRGGDQGIIANATDTCANPQVATAKFFGQDNDTEAYRIRLRPTSCEKKKHKKRRAAVDDPRSGRHLLLTLALSAPAAARRAEPPVQKSADRRRQRLERETTGSQARKPLRCRGQPDRNGIRLRLQPQIDPRLQQTPPEENRTTRPAPSRRRHSISTSPTGTAGCSTR